jgi:hypothetical protein
VLVNTNFIWRFRVEKTLQLDEARNAAADVLNLKSKSSDKMSIKISAWQDVDIFNKNLIEDPTKQIPGFDLPRKIWCKLNRFRTGHGKCNNMLFHWNIRENPSCECGAEKETIQHIVEECPLTKFQQGFSKLHLLTEDALNWLQQIKNI